MLPKKGATLGKKNRKSASKREGRKGIEEAKSRSLVKQGDSAKVERPK